MYKRIRLLRSENRLNGIKRVNIERESEREREDKAIMDNIPVSRDFATLGYRMGENDHLTPPPAPTFLDAASVSREISREIPAAGEFPGNFPVKLGNLAAHPGNFPGNALAAQTSSRGISRDIPHLPHRMFPPMKAYLGGIRMAVGFPGDAFSGPTPERSDINNCTGKRCAPGARLSL